MVASLSVGDKMIAIAALAMLIFGLIPVFEDESVISAGFELSFITGVALLLMPVGLLAIVIASWRNVLPSAVRTIVTAALGGLATAILVYWVPMFNSLKAEGTWVLWIWGLAGIAGVAGTIVDLQRGLP
ncbi:MAG: hypothetical protein OEV43_08515 [Coriobacteriia bacterium]|nr:hypothetical protein [Coriobacteriia bacterium]